MFGVKAFQRSVLLLGLSCSNFCFLSNHKPLLVAVADVADVAAVAADEGGIV